MDSLKTLSKKKKHKSRVRQFYSDFNSSDSSSDNASPSPFWEAGEGPAAASPDVFTFDTPRRNVSAAHRRSKSVPRAPRAQELKPVEVKSSENGSVNGNDVEQEMSHATSLDDLALSPASMPLVSPGLSRNQDMKDKALALIYQKKIKDLQSIQCAFRISTTISSLNACLFSPFS